MVDPWTEQNKAMIGPEALRLARFFEAAVSHHPTSIFLRSAE
jgi:hypothetical protein